MKIEGPEAEAPGPAINCDQRERIMLACACAS
jgi:hypothetical protein